MNEGKSTMTKRRNTAPSRVAELVAYRDGLGKRLAEAEDRLSALDAKRVDCAADPAGMKALHAEIIEAGQSVTTLRAGLAAAEKSLAEARDAEDTVELETRAAEMQEVAAKLEADYAAMVDLCRQVVTIGERVEEGRRRIRSFREQAKAEGRRDLLVRDPRDTATGDEKALGFNAVQLLWNHVVGVAGKLDRKRTTGLAINPGAARQIGPAPIMPTDLHRGGSGRHEPILPRESRDPLADFRHVTRHG
jgi:hypothetical protein